MISGEVFLTTDDGGKRRLGPGDMAFFPTGSRSLWRVPRAVRKLAVCRQTLPPPPPPLALRAWIKLVARLTGVGAAPTLDKRPPLVRIGLLSRQAWRNRA